jgi:hypothetical protein
LFLITFRTVAALLAPWRRGSRPLLNFVWRTSPCDSNSGFWAISAEAAPADEGGPGFLGLDEARLGALGPGVDDRQAGNPAGLASHKGFRLFWTWRVQRGKRGPPTIQQEVRDLIRMISRNNPRWGAPRIHGELLKLGIEITEPAVAKYMVRHRKPPVPNLADFPG